ncbi:MAG: LolA family protein [Fimbriimonadales bacterium]
MLTAIALLALTTSATDTGTEVVSKMLSKFHTANTVKGTIAFVQTASSNSGTAKVTVLTSLAMSKPNLFFIEQLRQPAAQGTDTLSHFVAVSDGTRMSYTVPPRLLPMTDAGKHGKFYEVAPKSVEEGLNAFCTMLIDRSLPIALGLYNPYEITTFTRRLSNVTMDKEDAEISGIPVYRIKADYTYGTAQSDQGVSALKTPAYIYVDKNYNLVSLIWQDLLGTAEQLNTIRSEWTVNLQTNVEVDKELFKVK